MVREGDERVVGAFAAGRRDERESATPRSPPHPPSASPTSFPPPSPHHAFIPQPQLPTIGAFTSKPDFASLPEPKKMAAKQIAEKLISEHLVAVFSKSYCPYCRQAKSVLSSLGLPESKVGIIELDEDSNGADVQAYLADKTGQRTVPNVFINGKHLGGCSDVLDAQKSGELKKLVSA